MTAEKRTIVRMTFGSHLYGTETPDSDLDFKSVFLPDGKSIVMQRVTDTFQRQRVKAEGEKNVAGERDEEEHSLQKYLELLSQGQTVALDMLFAPDYALLETTPAWEFVRRNRHRLLTRKSAAFVGYCRQQANKYGIKGSRVRAMLDARNLFNGFIEAGHAHTKITAFDGPVCAFAVGREHVAIVELPISHREPGRMLKHLEVCGRKVPFTVMVKDAFQIYDRVYQEYGHRARLAEENAGIDWKALSHAVRVGREALELMRTGHITFPLPYREHILAIKTARLPYADVASEIEELLSAVERGENDSVLPEDVDREWIDDFVFRHYLAQIP